MKSVGVAAFAGALFASSALADVPSIEIKGSKFFYSNNGTQFYMRGVAYQPEFNADAASASDTPGDRYIDPLADPETCKRDIEYLKELRTNTIRVYAINPEMDHDECMTALQDAGIYLVADLSSPGRSIISDDPKWDDSLYDRYTAVIDAMAPYNNTIGFFAGNEVTHRANNTDASAFVKAAVRDSKAYIKERGYRAVGVGYATNDDADIRDALEDYFNCGEQEESVDFWGYNIYSWCGDSSFSKSGYDEQTKKFADYPVPVFFAEYGCNVVQPRKFTDTPVLFGDQMNDVFSGGIVYMYHQEANEYGLVTIDGDTVSTLADFDNYKSQIAKATPTGVNRDDYEPTNTRARDCPAVNTAWMATASPLPPRPNTDLCRCMYNSLSCVVSPDVDSEDYGDVFGQVCGMSEEACAGIASNATTGTYGAYSMCNTTEQLAFVLNRYYELQDQAEDACAFDGQATLKSAVEPSGECASLMEQAGTAGTATVTSSATGGAAASGSSGASAGAASGMQVPGRVTVGAMTGVGVYFVTAFLAGAGMILL
ncbi:putative beta-glucanosyltransferase gel4 protein [Botryosphaeria dothidea]|uniref:1,3-beta-glucanosyltransferase n=1 Tax=Botryosphaeria dothidea TaxID=55169 RepID=A0A8H4N5U3_9PEZI|nr:putative beta-glucanosyltransferase gel4 protein [Botryosphaeria dothidea]